MRSPDFGFPPPPIFPPHLCIFSRFTFGDRRTKYILGEIADRPGRDPGSVTAPETDTEPNFFKVWITLEETADQMGLNMEPMDSRPIYPDDPLWAPTFESVKGFAEAVRNGNLSATIRVGVDGQLELCVGENGSGPMEEFIPEAYEHFMARARELDLSTEVDSAGGGDQGLEGGGAAGGDDQGLEGGGEEEDGDDEEVRRMDIEQNIPVHALFIRNFPLLSGHGR